MINPGLIKRSFDLLFASLLLALLLIPFILIAFLILIDSGRPVFFAQERAGWGGRAFRIYKFRTMIRNAERLGLGVYTEENDPRITRVGRWLRKWSLDELPQLFNVIKGDMSVVGPRPTLPYQVARYNERQQRRLSMRPGITGLAQVKGRNTLTWPERIELDIQYIETWSIWQDLLILLKTFRAAFGQQGIYGQVVDEISATGELKTDQESGLPR